MKPNLAAFALASLTFVIGFAVTAVSTLGVAQEASAHGVSTCPTSRAVRIENEQISSNYVVVGETIRVTGELQSLVNRAVTVGPILPVVDKESVIKVTGDKEYFSKCNPPPPPASVAKDMIAPDWQIVNSSIPAGLGGLITLEPGGNTSFSIDIKSTKVGTFVLFSGFVFTFDTQNGTQTGIVTLGRGQSVNVYAENEGTVEPQPQVLQIDNKNYSFNYELFGASKIDKVLPDSSSHALSMVLATSGQQDGKGAVKSGLLELELPNQFLDNFFASSQIMPLVDGNSSIRYDVPYSSCDKIIMKIYFDKGAEKIELTSLPQMSPYRMEGFQVDPGFSVAGSWWSLPTDTNANSCAYAMFKEEKKLHVDIDSKDQGYFSVLIPERLMFGNYTVLVDGKSVPFRDHVMADSDSYQNSLNMHYVSFNYPPGTTSIDIIGTSVIPEFDSSIVSMLIMTASITGVIVAIKQIFPFNIASDNIHK